MRVVRVHPAEYPADVRDSAYTLRSLSIDEIVELRDRRTQGWSIDALANAYGISRRSVYRWVRGDIRPLSTDGWKALFRFFPDHGPQRLTTWRREAA